MGKKVLRFALRALVVLVVLLVALVVYVQLTYRRDFSSTPKPEIAASKDPEVIARGAYLATAVAHCSSCHGGGITIEDRKLGDPKDLRGGLVMAAEPFGTFHPSNITPDPATGIGKLSDGELARVIRHGVAPDGKLDAFMVFAVGPMADEDLVALVSYLRSLPPIWNPTKPDEWGPVAKMLAGNFAPRTTKAPAYAPPGGVSVARGDYLANGPAVCFGCHSPFDAASGFKLQGPRFSGGLEPDVDLVDPAYEIIPPNLTPDPETGVLAGVTEDAFVERFQKRGRVVAGSVMPWESFAQLTGDDLRSVYRYLQTVSPVRREMGPSRRPR